MYADFLNERRVLGGLMELGDEAFFDELVWDVKFFDNTNMQKVMQLILDQVAVGEPYDRFTVLVKAQRVFAGDVRLQEDIIDCWSDKAFTIVDLRFWHRLVVEGWQFRASALQAKIIQEQPENAGQAIQALSDIYAVSNTLEALRTVQEDYQEHLKVREEGVALLPTGEPSIDKLLGGGWRNGIYGIAGRPKQGKSMVMLHFARKLAEQNRNVLFVSYEMEKHQVYDRLQAAIFGIDSNEIAKNKFDKSFDKETIKEGQLMMPGRLVVVHPKDRDVTDLEKLIVQAKKKLGGLDAVFVDTLRL